ncbi:MAG: chemotaxis-specific protein-glutamate methyltransferase CheB [Armatimonadota bacterium]
MVDDSVFARRVTTDILNSSRDIEVVGAASNGVEALAMADKLKPDVITLDIEMPRLNGLDMLRQLMQDNPTPVVMLSSLTTKGANESIQALRLGAVDVMAKPDGSQAIGLKAQAEELIAMVLAAAKVNVSLLKHPAARPALRRIVDSGATVGNKFPIVIIASSTGGPRALRTLVPALTNAAGVAYLIVQHLPAGFSGPLARDLDTVTDLNVRESAEGDSLHPGDVVFAKAGYHTVFDQLGNIHVTSDPPLWGVRPSADVTMVSAVPVFGRRLIGVVLTGMGRDGANGTKLIKQAGGVAIAEHESSCVVYGMPRAAIETGAVDVVAPLEQIADAVYAAVFKVQQSVRKKAR